MGEPMYDPVHDVRRASPLPPDQEHRLQRDEHGLGAPRRTRAWIVVAAGVALVAVFVALVATSGGDDDPPPDGVVVDSSP